LSIYVYAHLLDKGWVRLGGTDEINHQHADDWAAENMKRDKSPPNTYVDVKHDGNFYTLHPSLLALKSE